MKKRGRKKRRSKPKKRAQYHMPKHLPDWLVERILDIHMELESALPWERAELIRQLAKLHALGDELKANNEPLRD